VAEKKMIKHPPSPLQRGNMATKKGNMGRKRGNVATGKRISKLENWEISKFVGEV